MKVYYPYLILNFCLILFLSSCNHEIDNEEKESTVPVERALLVQEDRGLNFMVVGDWGRCGQYNQQEVADQMNGFSRTTDPEFIISTGDNFYDNGVRSIEDPLWNRSFENVYSGADLQKDWFVVLGNHDYRGNPQAEIDYSDISRRWNMPSRYFTFVKAVSDSVQARFIFLDTSPFVRKYWRAKEEYADLALQDTVKQLQWLDSLLTHAQESWKIVIGHHPVYSAGTKHGNTQEMIEMIMPRLKKYGVQLYLAGHEHDLQHLRPERSKVDYIISGAGSEVRPTGKNIYAKFSSSTPGFALVSITGDSLFLNFVSNQGKVIYEMARSR